MKSFIRMGGALLFFFSILWFVSFQFDPRNVCEDHPLPEKKDLFWVCQPGSFMLKKGRGLERRNQDKFIWEKEGQDMIFNDQIESDRKRKQDEISRRRREEENRRKNSDMCSDLALLSDGPFDIEECRRNRGASPRSQEKRWVDPQESPAGLPAEAYDSNLNEHDKRSRYDD